MLFVEMFCDYLIMFTKQRVTNPVCDHATGRHVNRDIPTIEIFKVTVGTSHRLAHVMLSELKGSPVVDKHYSPNL